MGITGMIYMVTMVFSLIVLILSSSAAKYDYLQFTQQYQPAACNSHPTPCKDPPDKLFTVHGLWPSNVNGPDPENCKVKPTPSQTIDTSLKPQLEIIWPNVFNRADHESFWQKQWDKHGTCGSPTIIDKNHYFETVIRMYITEKQNVSYILSKANINPDGRGRTRKDIEIAIRNSTNDKEPKLKCQKKKNGIIELVEVSLCSNYLGKNFINCPNKNPGSRYSCPTKDIHY
uniref:St-RNase n=2 Tax=Pyrus communis TaxID=23211 RepID=A0A8W4_PYRCO|nr:St-RNase [Pyrus communis]